MGTSFDATAWPTWCVTAREAAIARQQTDTRWDHIGSETTRRARCLRLDDVVFFPSYAEEPDPPSLRLVGPLFFGLAGIGALWAGISGQRLWLDLLGGVLIGGGALSAYGARTAKPAERPIYLHGIYVSPDHLWLYSHNDEPVVAARGHISLRRKAAMSDTDAAGVFSLFAEFRGVDRARCIVWKVRADDPQVEFYERWLNGGRS